MDTDRIPPRLPDGSLALGDDVVVGASRADEEALRALHHAFLTANDTLDQPALDRIWSRGQEHWYFNLNGSNYYGVEDWQAIWDYYRPRFALRGSYTPGRLLIHVAGDLGFVAAEYVGRTKKWAGPAPRDEESEREAVMAEVAYYRVTQVCRRTAEGWRVVHAHFSEQHVGPRPEQPPAA